MSIGNRIPEQFKGAQTLETIDSYAFDGRRYGSVPRREELQEMYGEQGVTWDVIERTPRNQAEMLAQNMGLLVLDVLVIPGVEIPNSRQAQ